MIKKKFIKTVDLAIDDSGAILTSTGLEGRGKPDILRWYSGYDSYVPPMSGHISHDSSCVFIRVGIGGAYVSIDDASGQEKPFIIPPNYWREIAIPGGIPAGARIVARNLIYGDNFSDLIVEVR